MAEINIVTQLEAALQVKALPDGARKRGLALFESLSRPVRVALVGPEGSGKSALVNLLLGTEFLPETLSARVIEIAPGDAFAAEVSYDDGRLEAPDAHELGEIEGADRLLIASPNPTLKRIAIIEARYDDVDAMAEIAESADILLWCSAIFGQTEREVWGAIREDLRDHAFLVLTKADKLARKDRLTDTLAELQSVAEAEFSGLFPVATLQGMKALETKPKDKALWSGSGAEDLVRAVLDHADRGRQADLDQAELFLARYAYEIEQGAAPGPGKSERPRSRMRSRPRSQQIRRRSRMTREVARAALEAAEQNNAETAPEPRARTRPLADAEAGNEAAPAASAPEPKADATPKPKAEPAAKTSEPASAPPAPEAARPAAPAPGKAPAAPAPGKAPAAPTPAGRPTSLAHRLGEIRRNPSRPPAAPASVAEKALGELVGAGERLRGVAGEPAKVLELCAATAEAVHAILDAAPIPADLVPLADDLALTTEMMTLLKLENDVGPAEEAVTLLLQLKRDFEQRLAA